MFSVPVGIQLPFTRVESELLEVLRAEGLIQFVVIPLSLFVDNLLFVFFVFPYNHERPLFFFDL